MKHIQLRITGKVQGVYYRQSAVEKARALNLKGIVRNESDGSVYIEAEGEPQKLDELVKWCYKGSPSSKVADVKVTEDKPKNHTKFEIEYA